MDNTKIRLIFSRTTVPYMLFSFIVRFVTWSNWSHVAIMTDENNVVESTALGGGVKAATLDEFKSRATSWAIKEYDVKDAAAIIAQANSRIGLPYNYIALLGILFHIGAWKGGKAEFCSEEVAVAVDRGGDPWFEQIYETRITPEDIWMRAGKVIATSNG